MPKKSTVILLASGAVMAAIAAAVLVLGLGVGFLAGRFSTGIAVYQSSQTESAHPGYRRSTLIHEDEIYLSDYEEAALQPAMPDPSQVIGRTAFGGARICGIPGQPATAYIAGDVGSEMPAFAVFRHTNQPPFDWRTATFREMTFGGMNPQAAPRQTTNAALLAEVVRSLSEGSPTELPGVPFAGVTNFANLRLASEQLPGIVFCPVVRQAGGRFYLAESLMMDLAAKEFQARWIRVDAPVAEWMKGL
ncbi:MAG: hypothetical protein U1F65_04675 [Verrucomicrobiota bacterium]